MDLYAEGGPPLVPLLLVVVEEEGVEPEIRPKLALFCLGAILGGAIEATLAPARERRLWPGVLEKSTCFLILPPLSLPEAVVEEGKDLRTPALAVLTAPTPSPAGAPPCRATAALFNLGAILGAFKEAGSPTGRFTTPDIPTFPASAVLAGLEVPRAGD